MPFVFLAGLANVSRHARFLICGFSYSWNLHRDHPRNSTKKSPADTITSARPSGSLLQEAALADDQPTVAPPTGDSTAQVTDPASTTSAGGIASSGLEPSDAAPATATDAGLDLGDGFGDLKKKKKSGKKKAAFDLEAFEKEIEQSADPSDMGAATAEDPASAGGELGDDVFGEGNAAREGVAADGEQEAWLGSDRDYTYPEVGRSSSA